MKRQATLHSLRPGCRTAAQAPSAHPQRLPRRFLLAPIFIPAAWLVTTGFCGAAVTYQVGGGLGVSGYDQGIALTAASTFWTGKTLNWTSFGNSTNELPITSNTADPLDFVGDASNPGLYYANQDGYVFFRMRVYTPTFAALAPGYPGGSYMLVIDKDQNGSVDYGFAWDSQSRDNQGHGLEMCVVNANGTEWNATDMKDLDGSNSSKGTVDINGLISGASYRTNDGYVRTDDVQSAVSGLNTTFIDFAVSWNYLDASSTGLGSDRVWNVTAASIANSTDHGFFNADVMGAAPGDTVLSSTGAWSAIPEPTNALAGLLVAAGLLRRRRA